MSIIFVILLQTAFLALYVSSAVASQNAVLSIGVDNDGVFGVDKDYSSGVFLTYSSRSIVPYWWAEPLSLSVFGVESIDKWEVSIGHKLWTPSNIELEQPLADERPYAGYLYAALNYISLNPQLAQRFNLTVGVTGEDSQSEDVQRLVHSLIGSDDPNGWEYQVEEQVAGSLGYLLFFNLIRLSAMMDTEWEVSTVLELNGGNFRSDLSSGIMFRWGQGLAGSFGSAHITVEQPFSAGMLGSSNRGWFFYMGAEERYRFNDITIEGDRNLDNLPNSADYYEVTLKNWQASGVVGLAWYRENIGVSLTVTVDSAEFEEEADKIHGTGALTFYVCF